MYKKNLDLLTIDILEYIEKIEMDGKTIKEVMFDIGIDNPQKLYSRLNKLIKGGFIDEDYNFIRGIEDMKLYLPFFGWAQCGNNGTTGRIDDYPMEKIDIEDYNLKDVKPENFQQYFITRAKGKSMEPIIRSGDNLLIKRYDNSDIFKHKNYLIVHNGKAKVKKLIKNKEFFTLRSLNIVYPDLEIKKKDDFSVIGEFIKVIN